MEQITLDMIPNSHTPTAHISQYDSGRHIRFNLKNITLTGSETVTLKIRKTDGELVSKTIENHTDYVEYVSEKTDCDVSGKANSEIVISKDDVVIGSKNFILNIEADPYDNAGVVTKTASGSIATFETNLADELQEVKCEINASGGGGTPSTPIPLVGHSELNLTRCGVNLWNEEWELGSIDNSGADLPTSLLFRSKDYTKVEPNKTYYCYCGDILGVAGASLPLYFYDNDKNFISRASVNNDTFTTPNNACFVRFRTGTDFPHPNVYQNDISINNPSTDHDYHAYNGQTFTVAFGQTVYGGVYDKSGRLTITWGAVDLGTLDIAYTYPLETYRRFQVTMPDNYRHPSNSSEYTDLLCSIYKADTTAIGGNPDEEDFIMSGYVNDGNVYIVNHSYTDANAFKTAMSGVILAYPLSQPIVIDVPSISVFAENGTNNVFSDTGEVEVKYLYIA